MASYATESNGRTDQKIWEKLWREKHEGKMLLREVMKLETEFNIITNDTLTTKKPTISARLRAVHDAAMRQKEEVESKEEAKGAEELENGIDIQPIVNKPTWRPDYTTSNCKQCETNFTLFTRRHHCRACGDIYCYKCTTSRIAIPFLDFMDPVRVCDSCLPRVTMQFMSNNFKNFKVTNVGETERQPLEKRGGKQPQETTADNVVHSMITNNMNERNNVVSSKKEGKKVPKSTIPVPPPLPPVPLWKNLPFCENSTTTNNIKSNKTSSINEINIEELKLRSITPSTDETESEEINLVVNAPLQTNKTTTKGDVLFKPGDFTKTPLKSNMKASTGGLAFLDAIKNGTPKLRKTPSRKKIVEEKKKLKKSANSGLGFNRNDLKNALKGLKKTPRKSKTNQKKSSAQFNNNSNNDDGENSENSFNQNNTYGNKKPTIFDELKASVTKRRKTMKYDSPENGIVAFENRMKTAAKQRRKVLTARVVQPLSEAPIRGLNAYLENKDFYNNIMNNDDSPSRSSDGFNSPLARV